MPEDDHNNFQNLSCELKENMTRNLRIYQLVNAV